MVSPTTSWVDPMTSNPFFQYSIINWKVQDIINTSSTCTGCLKNKRACVCVGGGRYILIEIVCKTI